MVQLTTDSDELFFDTLVRRYVEQDPRFLRRDWLAARVGEKLQEVGHRFVLLTAEPGAGKSVFMAQLAHDHPEWLRYFIRRDQSEVLADVSATSFLLRIGYQLAARQPELFTQEQLRLSVVQRIGEVGDQAEVVGAEVKRLIASPFYQKLLEIEQRVGTDRGKVVGLRVEELVVESRMLEADDLLHLALIHPARALQRTNPAKQIIVLVDALDEIRHHPTSRNILAWLTNCPELPENLRFVLTSRPPDEALRLFCDKQASRLSKLTIAEEGPRIKEDIARFMKTLVGEKALAQALQEAGVDAEAFTKKAAEKAHGNLGYLGALARGIDRAIAAMQTPAEESRVGGRSTLDALLTLKDLPTDIQGLYAFFLHQIKAAVGCERVEFKDPKTSETFYVRAWPAVYDPILGVLAIAMESLNLELIERLGGIRAKRAYIVEALDRLLQFLEVTNNRYRLYHATVAEFLTHDKTRDSTETADLYHNAQQQHRQVTDYYWQIYHERWDRCDDAYALNHLARHLFEIGDAPRLRELVCEKWMLARFGQGQPFGNLGFISDIDHAWSTALTQLEGAAKLVELFRLQMARQVVSQQTSVHTDTDLRTLVCLGRVDEAIGLCRLRSNSEGRYFGLHAIFTTINEQCQTDSTAPARTTEEIGQRVRQLLNEAEGVARAIRNIENRVYALGEVARYLDRMGDRRADALFDEAKKIALDRYWFELVAGDPNAGDEEQVGLWALMTLAEILIDAQRFSEAETIAGTIRNDGVSKKLAVALAHVGNCREGERIARTIDYPAKQSEALSAVAAACAQAGIYQEAERIARSIEMRHHQVKALCALAVALAQANDERATALLEELSRLVDNMESGHQTEAMSSLSAALAQVARYEDAENAIREIPKGEERVEALVLLALALAKAGDAQARRVFGDALEAARAIEEEYWRWRSVGVIVEALVRAKFYPKAEEISCTLLVDFHQAEALRLVATALARIEDSRAAAVIDAARRSAQVINDTRLRAASLLGLVLALPEPTDRADAILDDARTAAYAIEDTETRLAQLSDMAYALARRNKDRARASAALGDAVEARREATSGQGPDLERISALLADADCFGQAEEVARRIASPYGRTEALRYIGAALARVQNPRTGTVLDETLKAIGLISSLEERAEALCSLAETLCDLQDVRADLVLEQALGAIHAITTLRVDLLIRVAEAFVRRGYYDKGQQVIYAISEYQSRSAALGRLALGLASAGDFVKADEVARAVDDRAERAKTLISVALVSAQKRDPHAAGALNEALELTDGIDAEQSHARALCDLAICLAQTGDRRSSAALSKAREAAEAIADPEARAFELTHFGSMLHQIADSREEIVFNEARSAANDISGSFELATKGRALYELASTLSWCGRFNEAKNVTEAIEDEAWRTAALRDLAKYLAECGQEEADAIFDEAERQLRTIQQYRAWRFEAHQIVGVLASAGRFLKVLNVLELFELDEFTNLVVEIIPNLEKSGPKISVELLREISGVAGWARPRWRQVHDLLRS